MQNDEPRNLVLSGDAAKRAIAEDLFGLREIAKVLAEAVRSRMSADGYSIGIEGTWGSGKTTLLNFVADILGSKPHAHHKIIRFEPWLVGNKESLLRAFFKELLEKVEELKSDLHSQPTLSHSVKDLLDRLAFRIEHYADYLEFGASTVAGTATFDPTGHALIAAFVLKTLSAIARLFKRPTQTIEARKEKIADDLRALTELLPETRITVFIDDTDRLDPKESVEILRLIKAVANFPLITYLVSFDRTILAAQVLEIVKVGSGEDYLEKIFQLIVPLPPQEPFALRRFIRKQLVEYFPEAMVSAEPGDPELSARQDALFDAWIGGLIETPRDAIRLCDAVKFGWPYLRGGSDFLDYVWLQLIKLKAPNLYAWTQKYVANLGSYRDGGRPGDVEPITEAESLRSVLKEMKWSSVRGRSRMTYFLPGLAAFEANREKGSVFDISSRNELLPYERGKRLGSPIHWRYYFAFEKPSYGIDDTQFTTFLRTAAENWNVAAGILRELARQPHQDPGRQLDLFLDQFDERLDHASPAEQVGTAEAFAEVMDEFTRFGAQFSDRDPWRKAAKLLRRSVGPHFKRIVSERSSICWLAFVVREQGYALGVNDKGRELPDRQWLTRYEFDQALSTIIERFRSMGIISIFDTPGPIYILFCWLLFGDSNELRTAIDLAAREDAIFIKALHAMKNEVVSSVKGLHASLEENVVASFMDSKAAKERLDRIWGDEKLDKDLRQSAGELLSIWVYANPQ